MPDDIPAVGGAMDLAVGAGADLGDDGTFHLRWPVQTGRTLQLSAVTGLACVTCVSRTSRSVDVTANGFALIETVD